MVVLMPSDAIILPVSISIWANESKLLVDYKQKGRGGENARHC